MPISTGIFPMEWRVRRHLLIGGERSLEGVARGGLDGDDVGAGAQ